MFFFLNCLLILIKKTCFFIILIFCYSISIFESYTKDITNIFPDLAENLLPSVVNISTTQIISGDKGRDNLQLPPSSPFEDFFKDFFSNPHNSLEKEQFFPFNPKKAISLGSGFIIDSKGYIVTNNHVIQDAEEITVILYDDTQYKAQLIGNDQRTDIALLKIDSLHPLKAIKWGNSEQARVGDWVMAIGNPFGLGGSVTTGIISAKTRDINSGPYDSFIQTDAAINKGNSGGPLLNMDGQVIGINTAIYSPSGGFVGIGFAIPSRLAEGIITQIKEFGRTRRGWIGVRIQTITDEIAEGLGLDNKNGALVASITKNSPANNSGIQVGDIILSFNKNKVHDMRSLPKIVAETKIGTTVQIIILRNGKKINMNIAVGELEKAEQKGLLNEELQKMHNNQKENKNGTLIESIGIRVLLLDDKIRSQYAINSNTKGLFVTFVDPESDAAKKGLDVGTIIIQINQIKIHLIEDLILEIAYAQDIGRNTILMLVEKDFSKTFIPIKITS